VEGMPAGVAHPLHEFAELAQRLVRTIDAFDQQAIAAVRAEGWNSGQTFGLRADLVRAVEVAEKVMRRCSLAARPK
jgi:predicted HAD superfamily phosphohydrolase